MTTTEKSTEKGKVPDTKEGSDEDDRTIFVGNLSEKVSDDLLFELFLQGGPIEEISIPKDRESGKQKSFGFVRYKHAVSVPYACEIYKGTRLFGRELNIKSRNKDANPKTNQEPRGLSALVQGFHGQQNMTPQNMLPKLPQAFPLPNSLPMVDPIFLQALANANPYGDIKFGEYNNGSDKGRHTFKEQNNRRNRNDDRRHNYSDNRRHGDRRTDKWKNNRR